MKPLIRAACSCAPGPPRAATSCIKTVSGAVVCRLAGDVDPDSARAASQVLASALDQVQRPGELFVDLAEVRYFCAAGLTVLLELREAAAAVRVPLLLVAPSPLVCRVLQVTDTRPLFAVVSRLQPAPTS
jgi:anti-anti-sigma factor